MVARWRVLTAVLLALALLCLGDEIQRNPTKKKDAGPLFKIHYGDKWGFMDRTGKIVIQPQLADVSDFFDGLARVEVRLGNDYKSCFIDERGNTVIPCNFDAAGDFSEGFAPVRVGRLWGYIDRSGKSVIAPQFQAAAEFSGGLGRVEVWDRVQCSGKTYTKNDAPIQAFAFPSSLIGSGCATQDQRFGFVNLKGQLAIRPTFFWAGDFSQGLAVVRIEEQSKSGFIDKNGTLVIAARFDIAYSFSEGLAAVEAGVKVEKSQEVAGRWGFIDKTGNFAVLPKHQFTMRFSEGLAACEEDFRWGFLDRTGSFCNCSNVPLGWRFLRRASDSDKVRPGRRRDDLH